MSAKHVKTVPERIMPKAETAKQQRMGKGRMKVASKRKMRTDRYLTFSSATSRPTAAWGYGSLYANSPTSPSLRSRSAAMELGPRNIRVNAVSPGLVFTPRVKKALSSEDWKRVEATNPLRRMAEPEDIAKSILLLSSHLASYVNGNILVLDGAGDNNVGALGLTLKLPTSIPTKGTEGRVEA
jgi:NAD(P)-dependent dehydrogenase (short-subunit alcohol dehydrogenase family)